MKRDTQPISSPAVAPDPGLEEELSVVEGQPSVSIIYPQRIAAEFPGLSCMAQFSVRTSGLRAPFRQVSWSAAGMVANPKARTTPILFDVQGARPQQVLSKAVSVRVTDADGLTAEATVVVPVHVTWNEIPLSFPAPAVLRRAGRGA